MDSFNTLKIEQKTDHYFSIKNNRKILKIKIQSILCPFGIDEEYGNYVLKLEFDETNMKHLEIIESIRIFENNLKEEFKASNKEWKSLLVLRENNHLFLEAKIKKYKGKLMIDTTYDNNERHLNTIYDLGTNKIVDVILEIPTLWDYRKKDISDEHNDNKIGLILNINKIHIYD